MIGKQNLSSSLKNSSTHYDKIKKKNSKIYFDGLSKIFKIYGFNLKVYTYVEKKINQRHLLGNAKAEIEKGRKYGLYVK